MGRRRRSRWRRCGVEREREREREREKERERERERARPGRGPREAASNPSAAPANASPFVSSFGRPRPTAAHRCDGATERPARTGPPNVVAAASIMEPRRGVASAPLLVLHLSRSGSSSSKDFVVVAVWKGSRGSALALPFARLERARFGAGVLSMELGLDRRRVLGGPYCVRRAGWTNGWMDGRAGARSEIWQCDGALD